MSQAGTGSLQGGSGDGGGTSTGKVGDEVEKRPSAAFWGHDCTSNCHLRPILPPATWAIPAGLTTASALLLGSDSSPQRQVPVSLSVWPVLQSLPQLAEGIRQFSAVTSIARSYTLASVGSLVHTQRLPFPGLIFFRTFVRNFKLDQSSQNIFFVMFIEKCHTRSKTKHLAKTLSHICR